VREREGLKVNHKKIERICREEKLSLRLKKRKRQAAYLRVPLPAPSRPNQRWAMDFVFDTLLGGRRFKVFTLVDVFTRESLMLFVDFSIGGKRVTALLDQVAELRGLPEVITCDNGPEFTSRAMDEWAHRRGVKLDFIRPGKPIENAYVESFNGKLRDECLNQNQFVALAEASVILEAYRKEYNDERPHGSLNGLTPRGFAQRLTTMLNKQDLNQQRLSLA
jgi:putative transposase